MLTAHQACYPPGVLLFQLGLLDPQTRDKPFDTQSVMHDSLTPVFIYSADPQILIEFNSVIRTCKTNQIAMPLISSL